MQTIYRIEAEDEVDGRFLAEVPELPGVLAYGRTFEDAIARVRALALRVIADRLEQGEGPRGTISFRFETSPT